MTYEARNPGAKPFASTPISPPASSSGLCTNAVLRNCLVSSFAAAFWSKNTNGSILPKLISRVSFECGLKPPNGSGMLAWYQACPRIATESSGLTAVTRNAEALGLENA